ncbi:MAG TPA: twin-arginine translocation signal domain-containing protein [Gemmatimonadales bacterium]|jgi:hypothetical protein|nr:twin-arginine translocation signal domain-containing protein [Gemmatimonadales bacterium]
MANHGHNRRQFLQRTALGVAGATLAGAVPGSLAQPETLQGVQARGYVAGRYFLSLDGVQCGFVKSLEGGNITAEVISEPASSGTFANKRLGAARVEPFKIAADFSMAGKLFSWIAAAAAGTARRQDGVVIACDYDNNAKSQREFSEGLITEIGFPACDAASKDAAVVTVVFQPQTVHVGKGSGKVAWALKQGAQKLWVASNFRLEIDGLDCTKVNKVDAITIRQAAADQGGALDVPNLKVTLSEVSATTWVAWHDDFVIKGNNDDGQEKGGRLVFLSPNLQTELASLVFHNLGIFRLTDEKQEANAPAIKRLTAELYCEKMELSYNAAVLG